MAFYCFQMLTFHFCMNRKLWNSFFERRNVIYVFFRFVWIKSIALHFKLTDWVNNSSENKTKSTLLIEFFFNSQNKFTRIRIRSIWMRNIWKSKNQFPFDFLSLCFDIRVSWLNNRVYYTKHIKCESNNNVDSSNACIWNIIFFFSKNWYAI